MGNQWDGIWIYYSGFEKPHNILDNRSAIGLATLRLDGFASMDAVDEEAVLVTKPIRFSGRRLIVNVGGPPTGLGANMRVELLDSNGIVLPGFESSACEPIQGDDLRHEFHWKNGSDLKHLSGRPIRLRFLAKAGTKLYSFEFD